LSVELVKSSDKRCVVIDEAPSPPASRLVGYAELWSARRRAYRNGKWRFLKDVDKGLLNSAIAYLNRGCRIVSATVITRLRVAMKKLGVVNRAMILLDGEIKAMEMSTHYERTGAFKWVRQLKTWLNDTAYKFWLGTMQLSLEKFYPAVDSG
jgi:hypothetical protein